MSYTREVRWQSQTHRLGFRVNNLDGSPEVALGAKDEAVYDFVASASDKELRAFLAYALEAAREVDRVEFLRQRLSNYSLQELVRHEGYVVLEEIKQEAHALLDSPYVDQAGKRLFQSALDEIEGRS